MKHDIAHHSVKMLEVQNKMLREMKKSNVLLGCLLSLESGKLSVSPATREKMLSVMQKEMDEINAD